MSGPSLARPLASACLVVAMSALVLTPLSGQAPAKGKKYALLASAQEYTHRGFRDLRFTENDVTEMAKLLRKGGFDEVAADRFEEMGRIHIGVMDRKIAAVTLAQDARLLTANRQDFEQVPGLRFENWLD